MARAGKMRHWATFQLDMSDAGNEVGAENWQPKAEQVPCDIVDVAGQTNYRGVMIESTVTHVVVLRTLHIDITPDMRIKDYAGRILNIEKVIDPKGRQRELMITCTEVVK